MLRERLQEALKEAIASKDATASSTLRLILAALKDRDLAARGKENAACFGDDMVVQMLENMVRQRHASKEMYARSGQGELARQEADEIAVIERLLPSSMDEPAMQAAISATIAELGAAGAKDMGRVMSTLKQRYPGRMDFERAGSLVKGALVLGT
jgi:hypothetical protein